MKSHEQMVAECIENGWMDASTHELTLAGHEYCRALIAACDNHRQRSNGKKDQYLKWTAPCPK